MANNRRSGNNNTEDTIAYGDDTVELINRESAQLISNSMCSDNADSRKSEFKSEKTAELAENASNKRGRKANREDVKPSAADKSVKSSRKAGAVTERAAVEITEDKPKKRAHKSGIDTAKSAEETDGAPKKRAKKSKSESEVSGSTEDKSSEQDSSEVRSGCKTRQVMKLIEGEKDNLVVFAGKSRVPNLLRGRESLSAMIRRNAAGSSEYDDTEVVNITELVIRHEAAAILDRFNACSCEKCVNVFSNMIAERIPVRYARISRAELDSGELPERAVPMRQVVLPEMIRQLIYNKKRCFHDE